MMAQSCRYSPAHPVRFLGVLLALTLCPVASAQSMAEAAKKEAERREKNKSAGAPAPSYGDGAVKAAPSPAPSSTPSPGSAATAGRREVVTARGRVTVIEPSPRADSEAEDRRRAEENWRAAMASARARVERAQRHADDYRAEWWLPGRRLTGTIQEYTREWEQELAAARACLEELENKARREGVPPGWLR